MRLASSCCSADVRLVVVSQRQMREKEQHTAYLSMVKYAEIPGTKI